jgi:general secretion pathway protein G
VRLPASGQREVPRSCEISESLFSVSDHFYIEERGELDWSRRIPLMLTLARPPVREARLNTRQAANRAFTLIELLMVIAIIAILAAITFGVVKGVNERAAIGQAKAELASLAQALESYKMQYGDYPQTVAADVFLQSLIGKKGPKGADITGRTFVEVAKLSLSTTGGDPFVTNTLYLLDPWGRQYNYYYKATSGWTSPSYVLMSVGPDGYLYGTSAATAAYTSILSTAGAFKTDVATNAGSADNIYANQ